MPIEYKLVIKAVYKKTRQIYHLDKNYLLTDID
jgi:hypothetical protein